MHCMIKSFKEQLASKTILQDEDIEIYQRIKKLIEDIDSQLSYSMFLCTLFNACIMYYGVDSFVKKMELWSETQYISIWLLFGVSCSAFIAMGVTGTLVYESIESILRKLKELACNRVDLIPSQRYILFDDNNHLASIADRIGISDRAAAAIACAALQDLGVITEEDKTNLIDRMKIRRARSANRKVLIKDNHYTQITENRGLFFDERKDIAIVQEKRGNKNDLSTDQKYLLDMCIAVSSGNCSLDLSLRNPGKLARSRWLTLANRFLRLYVTTEKTLSKYIVKAISNQDQDYKDCYELIRIECYSCQIEM
ncbi:hypothetical protein HNY73_016737 [Argiope bruennichi]|uniref:Uncharacterized protein n=1 Tax=Argiope bruennichi TaxID=94029 RepID=A0A8T0ENR5_ARGBR|nr:hypothetical protein HNY73_016737 [Argiope bruennichi]